MVDVCTVFHDCFRFSNIVEQGVGSLIIGYMCGIVMNTPMFVFKYSGCVFLSNLVSTNRFYQI